VVVVPPSVSPVVLVELVDVVVEPVVVDVVMDVVVDVVPVDVVPVDPSVPLLLSPSEELDESLSQPNATRRLARINLRIDPARL
jgi:hypothetical protein